jgi:hypothetical protein
VNSYPLDKLFQEAAFIAYHFHWSKDEILEMPHSERHQWIKEISDVNRRVNEGRGR